MTDKKIGSLIRETVYKYCPECGSTEACRPGELNADQTIEYRRCPEGHVVEDVPHIVCKFSEATRFD